MLNPPPGVIFDTKDIVKFRVQGSGKIMAGLYQYIAGKLEAGPLTSYDGENETRIFEFCVSKERSEDLTKWLQENGATQKSGV